MLKTFKTHFLSRIFPRFLPQFALLAILSATVYAPDGLAKDINEINETATDLTMAVMQASAMHVIEPSSNTKSNLVEAFESYISFANRSVESLIAQSDSKNSKCASTALSFKQNWLDDKAPKDIERLKQAEVDDPDFYDDFLDGMIADGFMAEFQEFIMLADC